MVSVDGSSGSLSSSSKVAIVGHTAGFCFSVVSSVEPSIHTFIQCVMNTRPPASAYAFMRSIAACGFVLADWSPSQSSSTRS